MLHLEDGVLAEVHEALHLLLVPAVAYGCVEESFLGLLDLRFLPLVELVLVDLEVDSLNLDKTLVSSALNWADHYLLCSFDFNSPEERLEVVQNCTGGLQESENIKFNSIV